MDATTADADSGLLRNTLELDSWSRERTTEELRRFITVRHAALPADVSVE